jgi:hypothetical protein
VIVLPLAGIYLEEFSSAAALLALSTGLIAGASRYGAVLASMAPAPLAEKQRLLVGQTAVLAQYGRAMLSVQLFETQVSCAAMLGSVKDPFSPPRRMNAQKLVKKVLKRAIHLNLKATSAEAKESAAKVLPPHLMKEVNEAIEWRNRLVHRYLREKIIGSENGEFAAGTYDELIKLTRAFDRVGKRLAEENERIGSSWPDDTPPPPHISKFLEDTAVTILRNGQSPQKCQ